MSIPDHGEYDCVCPDPIKKAREDLETKRLAAIAWLRSRGKYILDKGTPAPSWAPKKGKPK